MKGSWNDQITLTLNEKGVKIYEDYFKAFNCKAPELKDNKLKIQLWDAAHIFGPHLSLGFDIPFVDSYFDIDLVGRDHA